MKFIQKNWLLIVAILYFLLLSPMVLIGLGYGALSLLNPYTTYQYCVKGGDSCTGGILFYLYAFSICYIIYRFFVSEMMIGRKSPNHKDKLDQDTER